MLTVTALVDSVSISFPPERPTLIGTSEKLNATLVISDLNALGANGDKLLSELHRNWDADNISITLPGAGSPIAAFAELVTFLTTPPAEQDLSTVGINASTSGASQVGFYISDAAWTDSGISGDKPTSLQALLALLVPDHAAVASDLSDTTGDVGAIQTLLGDFSALIPAMVPDLATGFSTLVSNNNNNVTKSHIKFGSLSIDPVSTSGTANVTGFNGAYVLPFWANNPGLSRIAYGTVAAGVVTINVSPAPGQGILVGFLLILMSW